MTQGRVLVIDDNGYARQVVCLTLTRAGYEVLEAEDGMKAIELMGQGTNASQVAAVVCDLEMPNLNGSETISYFKAHHPLIPIVILTGSPDFVLTDVLMRQGVMDYLLKPVSEKRLVEVVRVAVRLHGLRKSQA
jgi:two-component system chemotaxis response regulator CheY